MLLLFTCVKLNSLIILVKMYILNLIYKLKEFRKVLKERRKKHIYNHRLSRKGYARLEEDLVS